LSIDCNVEKSDHKLGYQVIKVISKLLFK